MASIEANKERSARRLLLAVGLAIAVCLALAMILAARRAMTMPFDRQQWDKGRNEFTADNPRMRMEDEAQQMAFHLSQKEVLDKFGSPDPNFEIRQGGVGGGGLSALDPGDMMYVLGLKAGLLIGDRSIDVLVVPFDGGSASKKPGRSRSPYIVHVGFPVGATISPVRPPSPVKSSAPTATSSRP